MKDVNTSIGPAAIAEMDDNEYWMFFNGHAIGRIRKTETFQWECLCGTDFSNPQFVHMHPSFESAELELTFCIDEGTVS